jgi:tetratricopeptide (TPR) repeat protein
MNNRMPAQLHVSFEAFIDCVVASVLRDDPQERTWALAERFGPTLAEILGPQADAGTQRAMCRMLARTIADRVPRPALRYATRRTPRPGRNDACDCGSGRKYKHCCAGLEQMMPMEQVNLLGYVLGALPRKRWAELAGSAVDPHSVAAAAVDLAEDGDFTAVVALLEPWFKTEGPIPASSEPMLDVLLDAYTELGNPRKKRRLIETALARGDRTIRSDARQRMATMAADDGDFAAAWRHFQVAQREDPDSESLSQLEVVLLMAQGDTPRAKERARFWIARLGRRGSAEYAPLIGFLREVAEQGEVALMGAAARDWPELSILREMITQMPAPAALHRLTGGGDESAGHIAPDAALRKALVHWKACFPQTHPGLTAMGLHEHPAWDDSAPWLRCLRQQPLLWQSFEVLDDLVLALTVVPAPGVEQALVEPLLERAETLFDRLMDAHNPGLKPVEWAWHQNRPALRLLAQRIVADLDPPSDRTVTRMERLITLNPNDNHGFRSHLMAAWLQHGCFERAEQLASRYGDDTELRFSRALALWAMGRSDEALALVREAHAQLPRLLPMLLAKNPRKPQLDAAFVTYGGVDQAWRFREQQRPAWEAVPGALDWLRDAARSLPKG